MISVSKIAEDTFEVRVNGHVDTVHTVTVDPAVAMKLTGGKASVERLLEKSFEFLLKREPNTSILRAFKLPVIGSYFPEYEQEIRKALEQP